MEEPAPAERPGLFGRSATRSVVGVLALAAVVLLEVERRRDEPRRPMPPPAPAAASAGPPLASVPVAPTLPPAPPSPSPSPPAKRAAVSAAASVSAPKPAPRPQPTPAPARLAVDFEHGFKAGSLAVFVDGQRVMDEPLRSRPTGKFLFFERREGRVLRTLPVEAGRRTVLIRVRWEDNQRSEATVARFREGRARTLVARLKPLTRSLSLHWR